MTSSAKPEVHNVSQRRQRRIEPRPRTTCAKIGIVLAVFEIDASGQTYKHAHRQIQTHIHPSQFRSSYPSWGEATSRLWWRFVLHQLNCIASILRRCTVLLEFESVSIFYVTSVILQCCLSANNFSCELFSVCTEKCQHRKDVQHISVYVNIINKLSSFPIRLPAEFISTKSYPRLLHDLSLLSRSYAYYSVWSVVMSDILLQPNVTSRFRQCSVNRSGQPRHWS